VRATIERLGLKAEELLNGATHGSSSDAAPAKTAKLNRPEEER